jgi:hypothetical protein
MADLTWNGKRNIFEFLAVRCCTHAIQLDRKLRRNQYEICQAGCCSFVFFA